jgi:hypothetical protein
MMAASEESLLLPLPNILSIAFEISPRSLRHADIETWIFTPLALLNTSLAFFLKRSTMECLFVKISSRRRTQISAESNRKSDRSGGG